MRVLLLTIALASAHAQPAPDAVLTFHFARAGMPVPEYTLTVHQDGTGSYKAIYSPPADSGSKYGGGAVVVPASGPAEVTQAITISPQTAAHLFERLRSTDFLAAGCESKAKNIADTGSKTITYAGPGGPAQCTYNYTETKGVAAIAETFQGIAETLDEGRGIAQKHLYDRLGLDQQLTQLQTAVKEGRAIEIGTIAPILQSLLDDTQVMERVRKRAAALLQTAPGSR